MSRIKGRYVAKLIVDIDIERTNRMQSLDNIKKNFRAFPNYLIGSLRDETDLSDINIVEEYFDLYEVEDGESDE